MPRKNLLVVQLAISLSTANNAYVRPSSLTPESLADVWLRSLFSKTRETSLLAYLSASCAACNGDAPENREGDSTMTRRFRFAAVLASLLLGVLEYAAMVAAQEPEPPAATEAEDAAQLVLEEAKKWSLRAGRETSRPELIEAPVLRWTNPHVGRVYGSVFMWTADGRPEAVASVFKWYSPHDDLYIEWKSLASNQLTFLREGRQIWRCRPAETKWIKLTDAGAPRSQPRDRLAQMRQIVRDFSAELIDRRDDPAGRRLQLRLLTQPIYRYGETKPPLTDGAVFAFVQGTDPEVLLLVEARNDAGGPHWQYAIARLNTDTLAVRRNSQEVWHVDETDFAARADDDEYVLFKVSNDQANR
jgi:hypothetical protein